MEHAHERHGRSENTAWATRPDIAYGQDRLFVAFVKPRLGWVILG